MYEGTDSSLSSAKKYIMFPCKQSQTSQTIFCCDEELLKHTQLFFLRLCSLSSSCEWPSINRPARKRLSLLQVTQMAFPQKILPALLGQNVVYETTTLRKV